MNINNSELKEFVKDMNVVLDQVLKQVGKIALDISALNNIAIQVSKWEHELKYAQETQETNVSERKMGVRLSNAVEMRQGPMAFAKSPWENKNVI